MKKEIDINIVKCEGVEIVKTVVENKNVKIVITRNDFSRYLHERYGKSDENENENKNIRVHDENEEEVKIKKVNIYSEKWRNAYGLSNIEKFEKGLKRGQEEKKEK